MILDCNVITDESGRELASHSTNGINIAGYDDDISREPEPWHWHDEFEAGIITEGRVLFETDHGRAEISKGEGFFVNSGILHSVCGSDSLIDCRLHSILFGPELVSGKSGGAIDEKYIQPLIARADMGFVHIKPSGRTNVDLLKVIEAAWNECASSDYGYEFRQRELVSDLIVQLGQTGFIDGTSPQHAEEDNDRIKRMLNYIHSNYMDVIDIVSVASAANISQRECLRCFHRTINTTPSAYIKGYRVSKARDMLNSRQSSISDIASKCGFGDCSYFIKVFREATGTTPGRYTGKVLK